MKAVVWHGTIQHPTDGIVRITSTALDHRRLRRRSYPDADDGALRQADPDPMGQANVKSWVGEIMPLLTDESDPLGTESFATHRLPLEDAPGAYEMFQKKQDGAIKVVLQP